jgi:hypothetical protein
MTLCVCRGVFLPWCSKHGHPAARTWPQAEALAAAAREGGDVKQAPGEAPQSGPQGNAQSDAPKPFSTPSLSPGGEE